MELTAILSAALFMALVLERLVELLVKPLIPDNLAQVTPYLTGGLGVLAAFAFSIDLITPTLEAFDVTPAVSWAGTLLTGLVLGGGSNLIHDLWPGE